MCNIQFSAIKFCVCFSPSYTLRDERLSYGLGITAKAVTEPAR